jgi:Fungal chitosanase of glycosyl hydrolase group 75
LVDVRPQNRLGEGSIALAKTLNIGERENGASSEQIVLYVFFAGSTLNWSTTEILSMASEHLKTLG